MTEASSGCPVVDYGNGHLRREGDAFQWVQAPPGNRSSRKQSEHTKWPSEDYAWLLHRDTGGGMCTRVRNTRRHS
jgi:hypothetical protein